MIDIHWFSFLLWVLLAFATGWALATRRANNVIKELSRQMDPVVGQAKDLANMATKLSAGYKTDRAVVEELRRQVADLKAASPQAEGSGE